MSPKKQSASKPSFEESMEQLETIVESMEGGDTPLDKLVEKFEAGTIHLKNCQSRLNEAELKIEKLKQTTGETSVESFEEN